MSETLRRVQTLVLAGEVHISDHGLEELGKDDILLSDILDGIATAVAVEDYRERDRGPSVLALQHDRTGRPIHAVWALSKSERPLAVLVTAYRPNPRLWDDEFKRRRSR